MKKNNICLVLVLLLACTGLLFAYPGIPHQLYGEVSVNGEAAPDNNIIVAAIGGNYYTTITTNGKYGLSPNIFYVEDPDGDRSGDTISFYLGGRVINGVYDFRGIPVGNVAFENNGFTQLDISTTTECGDGFCVGDETCSSCQIDCGVCMDPPIITITLPKNQVYNTTKIPLEVSANQDIIMWMYSLNSKPLITFNPNIIINAYVNENGTGENSITVVGINPSFASGSASVSFSVKVPVEYCGDGVCNAGETCSSCSTDCGQCPSGSSSSSSGGSSSGGGSSSSSSSGGTVVLNNNNTNEVVELNYEQENNNDENNIEQNTDTQTEQQTENKDKSIFSAITGAAVVVEGKLGWVKSILAIVVIVGLIVGTVILTKRSKKIVEETP